MSFLNEKVPFPEPFPKKAEDKNAAILAKLLADRVKLLNKDTSETDHEGSFMELQKLYRQIDLAICIMKRDDLFRLTPTAKTFNSISTKLQEVNKNIRDLQTSEQPTFYW